ncbi:MAG: hypothetical protein ACJZ85_00285 [Pontiellaceae bacterium]
MKIKDLLHKGGFFIISRSLVIINLIIISDAKADSYYLSELGNNSNSGSQNFPLLNVNGLDGIQLFAGDKVYFHEGHSFSGSASIDANGSSSNPIQIRSYRNSNSSSSNSKPILTGSWNRQYIFSINDSDGIEFHNLILENNRNGGVSYGIYGSPSVSDNELNHLKFIDLDFRDIKGSNDSTHESIGLFLDVPDWVNWVKYSDVVVSNCTFSNIDGIGCMIRDQCQNIADVKVRNLNPDYYFPSEKISVVDNYGTNCYRNLCRLNGTKNSIFERNVMDSTVEGSAFWCFAADSTLVQHNLFMRLRNSSADSYVCHFDYNCTNTLMQYNVGFDVDGGLVQMIAFSGNLNNFQEAAVARYNLGIDIGFRNAINSSIFFLNGIVDGGLIYNNTAVTYSKSQYKGIGYNNWGNGGWPSNCLIYNNLFYAADTVVGHHYIKRGFLLGNEVSHNLYGGNVNVPTTQENDLVDVNALTGDPWFFDNQLTYEEILNLYYELGDWNQVRDQISRQFRIKYPSKANGTGRLIPFNGSYDFFGNLVSDFSSPSVGFHEYTNDPYVDSDADKMPDQWELIYNFNPMVSSDALLDSDSDGTSNLEEFAFNGDPSNAADSGYSVSYSISSVNGDVVVNQLVPNYNHLLDYNFLLNAYMSTNLIDWELAQTVVDGIELDFYAPAVDRLSKQLIIDQDVPSVFFKTVVE